MLHTWAGWFMFSQQIRKQITGEIALLCAVDLYKLLIFSAINATFIRLHYIKIELHGATLHYPFVTWFDLPVSSERAIWAPSALKVDQTRKNMTSPLAQSWKSRRKSNGWRHLLLLESWPMVKSLDWFISNRMKCSLNPPVSKKKKNQPRTSSLN